MQRRHVVIRLMWDERYKRWRIRGEVSEELGSLVGFAYRCEADTTVAIERAELRLICDAVRAELESMLPF